MRPTPFLIFRIPHSNFPPGRRRRPLWAGGRIPDNPYVNKNITDDKKNYGGTISDLFNSIVLFICNVIIVTKCNFDGFVKSLKTSFDVIPAKAGIQCFQMVLDACLRRHDGISDFLRVCQFFMAAFFLK